MTPNLSRGAFSDDEKSEKRFGLQSSKYGNNAISAAMVE
jgi:hypothetical protein